MKPTAANSRPTLARSRRPYRLAAHGATTTRHIHAHALRRLRRTVAYLLDGADVGGESGARVGLPDDLALEPVRQVVGHSQCQYHDHGDPALLIPALDGRRYQTIYSFLYLLTAKPDVLTPYSRIIIKVTCSVSKARTRHDSFCMSNTDNIRWCWPVVSRHRQYACLFT